MHKVFIPCKKVQMCFTDLAITVNYFLENCTSDDRIRRHAWVVVCWLNAGVHLGQLVLGCRCVIAGVALPVMTAFVSASQLALADETFRIPPLMSKTTISILY